MDIASIPGDYLTRKSRFAAGLQSCQQIWHTIFFGQLYKWRRTDIGKIHLALYDRFQVSFIGLPNSHFNASPHAMTQKLGQRSKHPSKFFMRAVGMDAENK